MLFPRMTTGLLKGGGRGRWLAEDGGSARGVATVEGVSMARVAAASVRERMRGEECIFFGEAGDGGFRE